MTRLNTLPMHTTDAFIDSLSPDQLRQLAYDADATHIAEWKETGENKMWSIEGRARQVSPNRIVVWSVCDEAGINDVELAYGDDVDQEAVDHAHAVAANLDGRGVIEYVIAIVSKWERDSDLQFEVTEDNVARRLCGWIYGAGDVGDIQVAYALYNLV